jgi:hypothetical protein
VRLDWQVANTLAELQVAAFTGFAKMYIRSIKLCIVFVVLTNNCEVTHIALLLTEEVPNQDTCSSRPICVVNALSLI